MGTIGGIPVGACPKLGVINIFHHVDVFMSYFFCHAKNLIMFVIFYLFLLQVVSSYEPGDQSVGFDGPRNVSLNLKVVIVVKFTSYNEFTAIYFLMSQTNYVI